MSSRNNFGREPVRRFNILELERLVPNRKPRVSTKKKYPGLLTSKNPLFHQFRALWIIQSCGTQRG